MIISGPFFHPSNLTPHSYSHSLDSLWDCFRTVLLAFRCFKWWQRSSVHQSRSRGESGEEDKGKKNNDYGTVLGWMVGRMGGEGEGDLEEGGEGEGGGWCPAPSWEKLPTASQPPNALPVRLSQPQARPATSVISPNQQLWANRLVGAARERETKEEVNFWQYLASKQAPYPQGAQKICMEVKSGSQIIATYIWSRAPETRPAQKNFSFKSF